MESDLLMKKWDTYAVTAESAKGQCIISIISTDLGKKCQDQYKEDQIQAYIPIIEKAYGTMEDSTMMECICQDLTDPTPNQVGDYTDPYIC